MPKPEKSTNNGATTSFESILLKNKNALTQPQFSEKLNEYIQAVAEDGYEPPEEAINAILALESSNPAIQAALEQITDIMQELGLTLAITSDGGGETASVSIDENTSAVTTVVGTDPQGDPVTYTITGGDDAALFAIDPDTGELTFISSPDFEAPGDAGGDNVYNVTVTVTDTVSGQTDDQSIAVTVNDVVEGPPIEIDNVFILTEGSDNFWGAALNTQVDGLGGNDTIAGDANHIYDGRGPSPVRYMGDDWLNGGAGADTIYGDASHIFSYRSWYRNPTFEAGDDYIYGGEGSDRLYGDTKDVSADSNNYGGFNVIGGDDFMSGDAGSDYMVGDFDRVTITARNGVWNVEGGDDTIHGGDGGDTIYGDFNYVYVSTYRGLGTALIQNGDDRINGGAGNDHMWGDSRAYNLRSQTTVTNGSDTFVFNDGSGNDYIRDFQSGLDMIEVDGYGLTDFSQITITEANGSSTVHFDAGNSVTVVGVTGLDTDDFLFV